MRFRRIHRVFSFSLLSAVLGIQVIACSVYDAEILGDQQDGSLADVEPIAGNGGLAGGGADAGISDVGTSDTGVSDAGMANTDGQTEPPEGCLPNDDEFCPWICTEVCDGEDNDCDGDTDEGEAWAEKDTPCTVGVGECEATGVLICDEADPAGSLICSASEGAVQAEECDGVDNNCNGEIDERYPNADEDDLADCIDDDDDDDGVLDAADNCPLVPNFDQTDTDENGEGDACDDDEDGDGILDGDDNCTRVANPDQEDLDGDGIGDSCDDDQDGDGVDDRDDTCPRDDNPVQTDTDGDGLGNPCDDDDDDDGVPDVDDNCPLTDVDSQVDTDEDSVGDFCDNCPRMANPDQVNSDDDLWGDDCDNCPEVDNLLQTDTDDDTFGDECDDDDDDDGVPDDTDNCRLVVNPSQDDEDGDGRGDACDEDEDGDGVADAVDNCPTIANIDQLDTDGDEDGNACDQDDDGDEVMDVIDNCPLVANTGQENNDGDGLGDVCDDDDDNDGDPDVTDCAPFDASINHSADEVCDTQDNDCDGETDEDEAIDVSTWYRDADGDARGDASNTDIDCEQPDGYVADSTDCDDGNENAWDACGTCNDDDGDSHFELCNQYIGISGPDCNDSDQNAWDTCATCHDEDGDLYYGVCNQYIGIDGPDCENSITAINPGASEVVADGIDQNCDGVDSCYWDDDGDGYGRDTVIVDNDLDCTNGSNDESAVNTDCMDTDGSVNPEATETVADGIDQNCDGVDSCYWDDDGDGYGVDTVIVDNDLNCSNGSNDESAVNTDCLDTDGSVNPGATETIADGIDQNCDGVDSCYEDGDDDGYGSTAITVDDDLDCSNGSNGESEVDTDCDDEDGSVNPSMDDICNGVNDDCLGTTDDACGGFDYMPGNLDPRSIDFGAQPSATLNCGGTTTVNSTDPDGAGPEVATITNWCGTAPTPMALDQSGGPQAVVIPLSGLTISGGNTLRLIGSRPVILVVAGDVNIDGLIDADANGTVAGAGGNWSCGASQGGNGSGNWENYRGASGGGGGGFATAGGNGGLADSDPDVILFGDGTTDLGGSAGQPRADLDLTPLVGGCAGGSAGGCGTAGAAGGGAVQISASGTLNVNVTGTIRANGGNGAVPCGDTQEGGGTGGGSGGAILLESTGGSMSGSLEANGGNGGGNGEDCGEFTDHCCADLYPEHSLGSTDSGSDGAGPPNDLDTCASFYCDTALGYVGDICAGGGPGGGGGYGRILTFTR